MKVWAPRLVMGVLAASAGYADGTASSAQPAPLTPEAAVETVRFMIDAATISPMNPDGAVSVSPDGRTYVARLVRGDVARNGVWMELITGQLTSAAAARQTRSILKLFSSGLGAGGGRIGPDQDVSAATSPLKWLDAEHVAFLWSDDQGRRQVRKVNVRTGRLETLTNHLTSVRSFEVGASGAMLYCAETPEPRNDLAEQLRRGFVVEPTTDAASIIVGRVNEGAMLDRLWRAKWFFKIRPEEPPRAVGIAGRDETRVPLESAWLSPDGRWALINTSAPSVPTTWNHYEEDGIDRRLRNARKTPDSMMGRLVYQLWLLDTQSGDSRALWPAPSHPYKTRAAWSPNASSVLIAPAYLPPMDNDPRGRKGAAAVVIDPSKGNYEILPIDLRNQIVSGLQWESAERVRMFLGPRGSTQSLVFQRTKDEWRQVDDTRSTTGHVRLELRQDVNTPPTLVAVDTATAREGLVIDPNPHISERFEFGRAELMEEALEAESSWQGLLFYPPNFNPAQHYPLVIQSVYGGVIRDEFTLYGLQSGYGLGPAFIPPYPGRLLAAHGMLVLQLSIPQEQTRATPREGPLRALAFQRAAQHLIDKGWVDETRVGLIGFSRNGFFVEYALTHSDFPYAAAVASDHFNAGYFSHIIGGFGSGAQDVNGGEPFDDHLSDWLVNAPAFNADRVRTPLLQIVQSNGLLGVLLRWEMFSRLQYLRKPTELWVPPNSEFGVHNTQNPEQIVALQTRAIDWFRFWLNEEEDADPDKKHQYRRWRSLRELQVAQVGIEE